MKDTKEGYNYFKSFFQFFSAVVQNRLAEDQHSKSIKTLKSSSPQYLKSHWASFLRGGAAKVNQYPCLCCDITSNELAHEKILSERCNKCKETNKERCCHWDVVDSEYLNVSYY